MIVLPVDVAWLVSLVSAYAPQSRDAAGGDAVPPDRADQIQPSAAVGVSADEKRRLARDLWPVFGAPTPRERMVALERLLTASALSPHVDTQARITWSTSLFERTEVLTARCAVTLLEVVTTHGWSRLGTCAGCDCLDAYVDRAGRTPRKYCSATCLNRARVRAFRSRQATP